MFDFSCPFTMPGTLASIAFFGTSISYTVFMVVGIMITLGQVGLSAATVCREGLKAMHQANAKVKEQGNR